jgi:outer membrane lipoprotein LolB
MNSFFNSTPYSPYLFVLALLTLAMSGCTTLPNKEPPQLIQQTPLQRIATLQQLNQWKITGKIAFIEKKDRNSFTLNWNVNEKQEQQQLNLTSFLGINVLRLESTANNHEIQVNGKSYYGKNLEVLIHSITGFTLPTQALSFWLKGIPFQKNDKITYQKATLLPQTLSSNYNNELWQVNYANYQQIDDYSLATKFSIRKDDLLIKIAVNEWAIVNH